MDKTLGDACADFIAVVNQICNKRELDTLEVIREIIKPNKK